ncbi:unnamed protein product, partial [Ectocarpus sp. 12 AP-2014]
TKGAVIVESSSLAFNALALLPGPYIAAFVGKLGAEGLPSLLEGFEDKTAVAEHRVAFSAGPSATPKIFEAKVAGKIVTPRGVSSFEGGDASAKRLPCPGVPRYELLRSFCWPTPKVFLARSRRAGHKRTLEVFEAPEARGRLVLITYSAHGLCRDQNDYESRITRDGYRAGPPGVSKRGLGVLGHYVHFSSPPASSAGCSLAKGYVRCIFS